MLIGRDDHIDICFNFLLTFTFSWVMLLAPRAVSSYLKMLTQELTPLTSPELMDSTFVRPWG